MSLSVATTQPLVRRRLVVRWPLLVALLLALLTTLPYVYALLSTPADRVYTGLMLDAPDTLQYFSWLRDHHTALLVPNRMTSQPNDPALFNLLWLVLGQLQRFTGWSNAAIFQVLRLIGGAGLLWTTWWFFGLTARSDRTRGWAWALASCGGGLGMVWVIDKYARGLADVRYPFDLYVAEPNTVLSLLGYPHFLVAGALMVAIFGAALRAVRGGWRWWIAAAVCGLVLSLQHAYDLLTLAAVFGLWIGLITLRQRAIPWRIVGGAAVVGLVASPPAAYFTWLTSRDPLWRAVLSQFSNAGVWTPNPPHLIILLGVPLLLALLGLLGLRRVRDRSDGELLVYAWAIAGLGLIYLPVNFQIHLLNPLQVPLALLAVWAVERQIGPWIGRRWPRAQRWAMPAVLLLTLPTNLYLISWRFVELARYDRPYFLRADENAALQWLADRADRQDVVLSELDLGQFVAANTDARAVLAHWAQTVDFYATQRDVDRALDPTTASDQRRLILDRYGVSFVLATDPIDDPALDPVWQQPAAIVYEVER